MSAWRFGLSGLLFLLATPSFMGAGPAPATCSGDCNGDGSVTIDELLTGVSIAVGTAPVERCAALDRDRDGMVAIAELVAAVRRALDGCPIPEPTATPTQPAPRLRFADVTEEAGIRYRHGFSELDGLSDREVQTLVFSGGVAAGDYDGDGFPDLYVVRGDIGSNLLFRNLGDGRFAETGEAAGVAIDGSRSSGPIFADVDGDGRLDLFVGGLLDEPSRLFRNVDGTRFIDVTATSGLDAARHVIGAAFGDYDRDGDLDLYLSHWGAEIDPRPEHLWRNDGGAFVPVSAAAGIPVIDGPRIDLTFTPSFADIDDDRWPDLLIAADFGTSRVFRNRRDGTFVDMTTSVISDENGMGAAVGDYDNDGDLDWFVSSILDPDGTAEGDWGVTGNRLYRNEGEGRFSDVTEQAGVRHGFWGWGACFADFDNDGWLDLFHVNGVSLEQATEFHEDPSRLFLGSAGGTFREAAAEVGLDGRGDGRGVVCFDYDRDGDIDLFVANHGESPRLYRNDGEVGGFLSVRLRGKPPNSEGIGARLRLSAGERTWTREIRTGSNYVSQNPAEAHVGLGEVRRLDRLHVAWPDGQVSEERDVAVNRFLSVFHPALARESTPP